VKDVAISASPYLRAINFKYPVNFALLNCVHRILVDVTLTYSRDGGKCTEKNGLLHVTKKLLGVTVPKC